MKIFLGLLRNLSHCGSLATNTLHDEGNEGPDNMSECRNVLKFKLI